KTLRAKLHRNFDRCIAGNRSIGKIEMLELHRRKRGRNRYTCENSFCGRPLRQHYGFARQDIGRNNVDRKFRLFEIMVGQMFVDEPTPTFLRSEKVSSWENCKHSPPRHLKHVPSVQSAAWRV